MIKSNFKKIFHQFLITQSKYNYIDVGSSLPLNNFVSYFFNIFNIYLFEPNSREYSKLSEKFKKKKNIFISKKAIGLKKKLSVNLYSNKNLSSVLKINKIYNDIHPNYKYKGQTTIKGVKLDKILANNFNSILKIDAQGYGYECLVSAKNILKKIPVIIIEAEKVQMYRNQKLDYEISNFLNKYNYMLVGETTNYKKSLHKKNRKLNFYFNEFTYAKDLLFVKNFFEKKIDKNQTILIILCLILFHFNDLAYYLIQKSKIDKNLKIKLNELIRYRIKDNKKLIESKFHKLQKKKISLKKFCQILNWNDEITIFK